jgi:hypothetical protein
VYLQTTPYICLLLRERVRHDACPAIEKDVHDWTYNNL